MMPTITQGEALRNNYPRKLLQTILVPRTITTMNARRYLLDHGYQTRYHRYTKNYHRFMQSNRVFGATYYTKRLPNGIELVYQHW